MSRYRVLVKVFGDGCMEEVTAKQQNRTFVFYCRSQLEPLSSAYPTATKENDVKTRNPICVNATFCQYKHTMGNMPIILLRGCWHRLRGTTVP
jgi:hypothetical protein